MVWNVSKRRTIFDLESSKKVARASLACSQRWIINDHSKYKFKLKWYKIPVYLDIGLCSNLSFALNTDGKYDLNEPKRIIAILQIVI